MSTTHFDAVIVGSGFGGSVTAYRLARAGMSVCVLERGKSFPPGSFPRSPTGVKQNFWDPSERLYGMLNAWSFDGLGALVSSGLGGGSLVYANVMLRKPAEWFVREDGEYWPVTRAELDRHYDAVEAMLGGEPYPFAFAPYNRTGKTAAMLEGARALGLEGFLPRLAVTFRGAPDRDPVPGALIEGGEQNLHGAPRFTCRLCGECDFGCNLGSKNTLDYNYLSAAQRHGADLRTLSEVKTFAPREGGGFVVDYVQHHPDGPAGPGARTPVRLTADRLVLAAGTLGTTFLLLKNRAGLPGLSPALGTRFSGNGDLLGIAAKTRGRDAEGRPREMGTCTAPVITAGVRIPDAAEGNGATGRGFYILDAGIPAFMVWLMEYLVRPGLPMRVVSMVVRNIIPKALPRFLRRLLRKPDPDLSAELSGVLGDTALSATTLPMLGLGRDLPSGRLTLDRRGRLKVDWRIGASRAYFARLEATMRALAKSWGGTFVASPSRLLDRLITVHPLGGCPMGRTPDEGVVDAYGRVFGCPGLYVADGSVMPGPIGPNPSLTIAALADRFAEQLVRDAGRDPDPDAGRVYLPVEMVGAPAGAA
jgi:cholesterol oxidase